MRPSPVRRVALATLGALVAAPFSTMLGATPAQASEACLAEAGVPLLTCDDETPPLTGPAAVALAGSTATVTAPGTTPAPASDTGVVQLECQADESAIWGGCTFPGLARGQHVFRIRAYDATDTAITATCKSAGDCPSGYVEVPDYDPTPSSATATVGGRGTTPPPPGPNGAPDTEISGGPSDRLTPDQPVTLTRHPRVVLTASGPATFNCAINAKKVPCHGGTNVLKGLRPGVQVFVAQAVDQEGDFDATPASLTFFVPYNLTTHQGQGWRKIRSPASYAGDYVSTKRQNATLTLAKVKGVRELRLIAPTGPKLGKVAVRVGGGGWLKVNLHSATSHKVAILELRRPDAGPLSGAIQVRALAVPPGGAVAVDAIVAR